MTTPAKIMALLTLESDSPKELITGEVYSVHKDGYRIIPFNVPMELADETFQYLGKVKVTKIVVTTIGTDITFQVLKLFTPDEQKVYTQNFIKP